MRSHMLGMRPQTQGRFSVSTHTAWWKEWQSSILVLSQFLSTSLHTISLFTFHLRGYYSIQADLYLFFKHFSRICCQFRPVGKLVNSVGEPHLVLIFGPLICPFIILIGHTEKLRPVWTNSWFLVLICWFKLCLIFFSKADPCRPCVIITWAYHGWQQY